MCNKFRKICLARFIKRYEISFKNSIAEAELQKGAQIRFCDTFYRWLYVVYSNFHQHKVSRMRGRQHLGSTCTIHQALYIVQYLNNL